LSYNTLFLKVSRISTALTIAPGNPGGGINEMARVAVVIDKSIVSVVFLILEIKSILELIG
jgi:hypothetical protein